MEFLIFLFENVYFLTSTRKIQAPGVAFFYNFYLKSIFSHQHRGKLEKAGLPGWHFDFWFLFGIFLMFYLKMFFCSPPRGQPGASWEKPGSPGGIRPEYELEMTEWQWPLFLAEPWSFLRKRAPVNFNEQQTKTDWKSPCALYCNLVSSEK